MNATKQHGLIHLHMTVEEAKLLKALTGCINLGGEHGIQIAHVPYEGHGMDNPSDVNAIRAMLDKAYGALSYGEALK